MIVLKLEMRISIRRGGLDAHLVNRAKPRDTVNRAEPRDTVNRAKPRDTANRCENFLIEENYFGGTKMPVVIK